MPEEIIQPSFVRGVGGGDAPTRSGRTDVSWPIWGGKVQPGRAVKFRIDGEEQPTAKGGASGTWSFTPDKAFGDGAHSIEMFVTGDTGYEEVASWEIDVQADSEARQRDYARHKAWTEGGQKEFHQLYDPRKLAASGTIGPDDLVSTPVSAGGGGEPVYELQEEERPEDGEGTGYEKGNRAP